MTNIPESVMKEWRESAKLYSNEDMRPDWNSLYSSTNRAYISGRQDEWVKQREEIEQLKGLISDAYCQAWEDRGYSRLNLVHRVNGLRAFKANHNI